MVTAIVLLSVERDKTNGVAEKIAVISDVTEVYSVAGRCNLAGIIRVKENNQLASIVADQIRKVEGIEQSKCLIAFGVYSRFDLESALSLTNHQLAFTRSSSPTSFSLHHSSCSRPTLAATQCAHRHLRRREFSSAALSLAAK